MKRLKALLNLFLIMFKIGLFTFGGGYAMIAVFENEFVSKKKWLDANEFLDIIAIAESTPGPIAINTATYVGYKREKVLGSTFATFGMCLPSLIIIFVISLFFNQFLEIELVQKAFRGIQVAVVFLILNAGIKLFKKLEKSVFNVVVFSLTSVVIIAFSLFSVDFSSIFYILISALLGLTIYLINRASAKREEKK
ncbi:MAG: chromate transporter [Clostridia bacterium]|nr:chromate transporter [Clostridia bacterium]